MFLIQCDYCGKKIKENVEMCIGSFQIASLTDGKIRKMRDTEPYIVQEHFCGPKCFSEAILKNKKQLSSVTK